MGVLQQNKEWQCPIGPRQAQSQKHQLLRVPQLRFSTTPVVMAPYASPCNPMSKRTVAPRGTVLTPPRLPQNEAHEESWMKKVTWHLWETNPNKVKTKHSENDCHPHSLPSKVTMYCVGITGQLGCVTLWPGKDLGCCPLWYSCWINQQPVHYLGAAA